MNLLAIETATAVCSVAVGQVGRTVVERSLEVGRVHAERLAAMVQGVLEEAGVDPEEVDVVAVSAGPGSFTGLRIGLAFAKGFVLPGAAKLVLVPTLKALALPAMWCGRQICSLLRARRGEVYAAIYANQENRLASAHEAVVLPEEEIARFCPSEAIVVGETEALNTRARSELLGKGAQIWPPEACKARASYVACLGYQEAAKQRWADVQSCEPFYVQQFKANPPKSGVGAQQPTLRGQE